MRNKVFGYLHPSLVIFLFLILYNYVIRLDVLWKLSYLNDDSSLILGAMAAYDWRAPMTFLLHFYTPYGPSVIRPFQLLGIYFERSILGLDVIGSVYLGVAIFSTGLFFIWRALSYRLNTFGVFASCILISTSMVTAEPLLWLSDRHDIYLLFF